MGARFCPWTKLSTTGDPTHPPVVQITHPFHPLHGQSFRFVVSKQIWGEDRVTLQFADGSFQSLPINWTDVVPPDPYMSVGKGRSRFRVEDLLRLSELVAKGNPR